MSDDPELDRLTAEIAEHNEKVRAKMRRQTRRSFFVAGGTALAAFGGWRWLMSRRREDVIPWPMRRALAINEGFWRDFYSPVHLAPDFTGKVPLEDRVNADIGMTDELDADAWHLQVLGGASPVTLTMADIRKLPRTQMTTEFKCVEGWSAIMAWAGVRFSDFMAAYPPAKPDNDRMNMPLPPYVALTTPDGGYYVGLDMESMQHPQTLLAYEMNGAPLTDEHGAPLRLVTPLKYGVKNLKRIGTIHYQVNRPADYWAERGYDWYLGL